MSQSWRDVVVALRRLRSAPLFTVFSVVTLALGIGVTTAAYSLLYDVVWSDVGVREPDEVVAIYQRNGVRGQPFSGPEARDIASLQTVFSGVAPWAAFTSALTASGRSELIFGEGVGGDFFRVVGVEASLGRVIQPDDDRSDAPAVMVLSDLTWRTQFGGDARVIGTTVRMADRVFEVIGVAPPSFRGMASSGLSQGVWVALSSAPGRGRNLRIDLTDRQRRSLNLVARLRSGRSVADATAELGQIGQRLDAAAPLGTGQSAARTVTASAAFPRRGLVAQKSQTLIILSIPALVLLVACTNLANLVLSRGASRRHEFAVRTALGASRWQLLRSQLFEGALTAALAGLGADRQH